MKVLTLTPSPVIDVHFSVKDIVRGRENTADGRAEFAAGKGINISRALLRKGAGALSFALLGEEDSKRYLALTERAGIPVRYVEVPGPMREAVSLNCTGAGDETRICYRGFSALDRDAEKICAMVLNECGENDVVCVSGSLPRGVSTKPFVSLCRRAREKGAMTVVDSNSFSRCDIEAAMPWLIKPNAEEAGALTREDFSGIISTSGRGTRTVPFPDRLEKAVKSLTGISENVIISLGGAGALFASRGGEPFALPAVPIDRCYSSVGAGDNLIAGFIHYLLERFDASENAALPSGPLDKELAFPALERGLSFAAEICSLPR